MEKTCKTTSPDKNSARKKREKIKGKGNTASSHFDTFVSTTEHVDNFDGDKNRSLSIVVETNQSTNIGNR